MVITGSTKGLGLALAAAFLELGDDVCISSRDAARTASAAVLLRDQFPGRAVLSQARSKHAVKATVAQTATQNLLRKY